MAMHGIIFLLIMLIAGLTYGEKMALQAFPIFFKTFVLQLPYGTVKIRY